MFYTNRIRSYCTKRISMKKKFIFASVLIAVSTAFFSCSKENLDSEEPIKEVTLLGTWTSYNIDELGEYGEIVARRATNDYSITFTETNATMIIEDMPDGLSSITSTYEFKESDESIIYFPSVYSDYGLKIVAQFANGQVTIIESCDYWDYSFMYYFVKE